MKKLLLFILPVLFGVCDGYSVSIESKSDCFLLRGTNYSVKLRKSDGAVMAVNSADQSGRDFHTLQDGLWSARFKDNSVLTAARTGMKQVIQDGNSLSFFSQNQDISVKVVVTAHDTYIDFVGEFTPQRKPIIEFSVPSYFTFSPGSIDGVICHIGGGANPGVKLNADFFKPAAQFGPDVCFKQSRTHGADHITRLLGGPLLQPENWGKDTPMTLGSQAADFFSSEALSRLSKFRLAPIRPFADGQAEIAILTDREKVVVGGTRLGGNGAFLRWGTFNPSDRIAKEIMTFSVDMVEKLKADNRFSGSRKGVAVIALTGLRTMPYIEAWEKELQTRKINYFKVTDPQGLADALNSRNVAVIINPYSECIFALPEKNMGETIEAIKKFVQDGGYWLETSGYSFYYEVEPEKYLTSGKVTSPGSFADYFYFSFADKRASLAVYTVQPIDWEPFEAFKNPQKIYLQSIYEIGGNSKGGFLNRASAVFANPGETKSAAVVRLRFGEDPLTSVNSMAADNQIKRRIEDKISAELIEKIRNSVLYHPRDGYPSTEKGLREALSKLSAPAIVHASQYLKGFFDKQYPDHLPPNKWWGTLEGFQRLVGEIRARGMIFMPYTNNSWWCDRPRGSTFIAAGEEPLQILITGKKNQEWYGSNTGWSICSWHPSVRAVNDKLIDEFTRVVPSDIVFQDQIGCRGGLSIMDRQINTVYDLNPAAPVVNGVVEAFLSQARRDAQKVPLATEEGWRGLVDSEVMFCGFTGGISRFMSWQGDFLNRWPSTVWSLFPVGEAMAHDKLFWTHHDLAGDVNTSERVSFTLALGYMMVSRATLSDPAEYQWYLWIDRLQKSICSKYALTKLTAFEHIRNTDNGIGIIKTQFEKCSIIANLRKKELLFNKITIAPDGFYLTGSGVAAGDILAVGNTNQPAKFVIDHERMYIYGREKELTAVPLVEIPKKLTQDGHVIPFEAIDGGISFRLPESGRRGDQLFKFDIIK